MQLCTVEAQFREPLAIVGKPLKFSVEPITLKCLEEPQRFEALKKTVVSLSTFH